jgi:hypothetical protein
VWACGTCGGDVWYTQSLEVKAKGKMLLEIPRRGWEDDNKMDLKEII